MNKALKNAIRILLPRTIGPRRILAGPLSGQHLVTSWHDYPAAILGRTEQPLLGWFKENVRLGETWLDVGAHYGYTAIALAQLVGPGGKVYAFEPMTASAGCIARTRSINNLTQLNVVPFALGQCETIATQRLPQTRGMVDSTIKAAGPDEPFMVASLDWLWPRIGQTGDGPIPRVDGVKIDVQGMELEALKGMLRTLRQDRPKLVVELHEGVSRDEFLAIIDAAGYSPLGHAIDQPITQQAQFSDNISYAFAPAQ